MLFSIIAFFGFLGWYFERHKNSNHFRISYKGIWDGLWWAAVIITTVGYGDKSPITRQGKIIALTLMFGGLLFISGLTASIASSLTVDRLSASSGSFAKFKDQSVGTIKTLALQNF